MILKECTHRRQGSCLACPSRQNSIFSNISSEHIQELDKHKITNLYRKGQFLFHEGTPALGAYCVLDGQIKVLKNSENGKETITKLAASGDILGLRGVLTEKNHPASAKVMQDSQICFIDRKYFRDLIKKSPMAGSNLIFRLAQEVSKLETQVEEMTTKSVRQRLAQLLIGFCKTYGEKRGSEIFIDLKITRSEIASMIGTTPETVIRTMSDIGQSGIIRQNSKKIFVTDIEALVDEAGIKN